MLKLLPIAIVLSGLGLGCETKKPTCENAIKHGVALIDSDPAAPSELKEKFSRDRSEQIKDGIATCEANEAPEAALQCMLNSTTFAAFRTCDRSRGR